MDPWPPGDLERRRTLARALRAGHGGGGEAVKRAIRQVRPGRDVALVGAGAGLLALRAARAGARRASAHTGSARA